LGWLQGPLAEEFEGEGIGLAGEVLLQGLVEDGCALVGAGKKGEAGAELEVVRGAEDLIDGFLLDLEDEEGALFEARTEDGVLQVGLGFIERTDSVEERVRALAEAFDLGEDEPDPVAAFLAGAEFSEDLRVDGGLGAEETAEIEGVSHEIAPVMGPSLMAG
jgi:hypothetical protein